MIHITDLHRHILEALARYMYLTPKQLLQIGVSTSQRVVWRELRHLLHLPSTKRPYIRVIRPPVQHRINHAESVHYLTPRGATLLSDHCGMDPTSIAYPRHTIFFTSDFFHRKTCIDFHIALTQALASSPFELATCDQYFRFSGANRSSSSGNRLHAKTRITLANRRFIIPDLNLIIQSKADPNKRALFAVEVTNGRDTKRVLEKLRHHAALMQDGALSQHYGFKANYQALVLFTEPSLLKAAAHRLPEAGIDNFRPLFWFAFLNEVQQNVLTAWRRASDLRNCRNFITGK